MRYLDKNQPFGKKIFPTRYWVCKYRLWNKLAHSLKALTLMRSLALKFLLRGTRRIQSRELQTSANTNSESSLLIKKMASP